MRPMPFSPVHRQRKFSTVFGQVLAKSSISIRPSDSPPSARSMYTTGLSGLLASDSDTSGPLAPPPPRHVGTGVGGEAYEEKIGTLLRPAPTGGAPV